MNRFIRSFTPYLLAAWAVLLSACSPSLRYQTHVAEGESVKVGDVVRVEGHSAGRVIKVRRLSDGVIRAEFEIENRELREQALRSGVFRLQGDGGINLRTEFIEEDSSDILEGAVVPTYTPAGYIGAFIKYNQVASAVAAGIVLVALALLVALFRIILRTGAIVFCLCMGLATGWTLHRAAVPAVEKAYDFLDWAGSQSSESAPATALPAPEDGRAPPPLGLNILDRRPHPRIMAFSSVACFSFLLYGFALKRVFPRRGRNHD